MLTAKQLYYQRLKAYLSKEQKYYKKIFNNHFMIFLMICFALFLYGYKQAIMQGIQINHIFVKIFLFFVLCLVTNAGKIYLFFEDADRLFLLGKDDLIEKQTKLGLKLSFAMQSIMLLLVFVITIPLFYVLGYQTIYIACICLLLLVIKYLKLSNILLKDQLKSTRKLFLGLIYLTILISFFYPIVLAVSLVLTLANLIYTIWQKNILSYDIKYLIELEKQRLEKHYSLLSYFVDIKIKHSTIKERKYLNSFINKIQDGIFKLLVIKVVRNNELLAIVFRIIILDVILQFLMFNPNIYMQLALFSLLSWLIISQLAVINISLKKSMWVKLAYTKTEVDKAQLKFNAFCVFINWLCFSFSIFFLKQKLGLVVVGISAIIVVMLLMSSYLHMKKINKEI